MVDSSQQADPRPSLLPISSCVHIIPRFLAYHATLTLSTDPLARSPPISLISPVARSNCSETHPCIPFQPILSVPPPPFLRKTSVPQSLSLPLPPLAPSFFSGLYE